MPRSFTVDPHLARFVVAADQVKDGERVQTSKLKGTDYLNIAVSNQICLFDHLSNMAKLLRITDLHHKVKIDRDSYHDGKRTSAEVTLLQEMRKCNARGNILLREMLTIKSRMSNMEKQMNALYKTIGLEGLMKNLGDERLETIPEQEEVENEVEVQITNEIVRIQNQEDGQTDIKVEDEILEDLYGNNKVRDPDSSLEVVNEKELTREQVIYKKRNEAIAEAKETHGFNVELGDEAFTYTRYANLMENIEKYNFTGLTKVGPPKSPKEFKRRYGFDWTESMTLVRDFDPGRAQGRISQPRYLKNRVAEEKNAALKLAQPSTSSNSKASISKPRNTKLKAKKEINLANEHLTESDSDFEEPDLNLNISPTRKRSHGQPDEGEPEEKKKKIAIDATKSWYTQN